MYGRRTANGEAIDPEQFNRSRRGEAIPAGTPLADPAPPRRDRAQARPHAARVTDPPHAHGHRLFSAPGQSSKEGLNALLYLPRPLMVGTLPSHCPYSNFANNLFASACDSVAPPSPSGTRHLRSSSWPSVNSPSSNPSIADRSRLSYPGFSHQL